jgi:alanine racemase
MKRVSPTFVEVDLEALRHNYRQLRQCPPPAVKALCVVKSNAYGHGAGRVAKVLQDEGGDAFGVGTVDEGISLREAGVKKPVLILLGMVGDQKEALVRYQLTPVVYDLESATGLNEFMSRTGKRLPIHVKVDTGMTRLGFLAREFAGACAALKRLPYLDPEGLMTHLAEAGNGPATAKQAKEFDKAREVFVDAFGTEVASRIFHIANSQASIDRKIGGDGGEYMARLGIALYGAYPLERDRKLVSLRPVMTWKSRVIALKEVPSGTAVSYNRTYKTKKTSRIAVVPVGYADGYPRILSNRASVLIRGKEAPVAGIVCMDLLMVDVTGVPGASVGDEVVLVGRQGRGEIRAEDLAKMAGTISYEIFCRISERVPRVFT